MPSSQSRIAHYWAAATLCAALFFPATLLAGKNFVKPVARSAVNYPAHDFHRDSQVAIAADPYDTPDKAKIFSVDFSAHGFLPVFFVVTNDGDQPVSIANMEITLITAHHSKLTPVPTSELYRRLSNPQASGRPSPVPLPLPRKVKGTVSKKEMDEIDSSQFAAKAVEPHGTQSGFLFFDIGGIESPLPGSTIEITGIDDVQGHELMYFEISLDEYLNASKKTN
ncbi:MAG TPA: hypothetical protein VH350_18530 [Candidatus Sulfotelmatobacter sp.]|jgi:hypothetical protein|nr:hypothetical protein [Candidatus Sulfotelmatobacter sp.]